MKHDPFETWLLNGPLQDPAEQIRLESHLQTCPQCRRLQKGVAQLDELFGAPPSLVTPPGFEMRVLARLEWEAARQTFRKWLLWTVALGTGSSGMMFTLLWWWRLQPATPLVYLLRYLLAFANGAQTIAIALQVLLRAAPVWWIGVLPLLWALMVWWGWLVLKFWKRNWLPAFSLV
jgi:anti-sigma factor RsiW